MAGTNGGSAATSRTACLFQLALQVYNLAAQAPATICQASGGAELVARALQLLLQLLNALPATARGSRQQLMHRLTMHRGTLGQKCDTIMFSPLSEGPFMSSE